MDQTPATPEPGAPAAPSEPPSVDTAVPPAPPAERPPAAPEATAPPEGATVAGTPAAEEEAAAGPEAAPDTTLLGIVMSEGRPDAAVIEHKGEQEIFRKGDSVFEIGQLEKIERDAVLIRGSSKPIRLTITATSGDQDEEAPPPEIQVLDGAPPGEPSVPRPIERPIAREEARKGLERLADQIRDAGGERVQVAGKYGIKLAEVKGDSFLAKLGLKSGDVLRSIGTVTVDDPGNIPDLSKLTGGKRIAISFWRDGLGLTLSREVQ